MKKTIFTLFMCAIFGVAMAQNLTTYSVYDTNQSGDLTVADVTGVVNQVKTNVSASSTQQYVTADELKALFYSIGQKLDRLERLESYLQAIAAVSQAPTLEEWEKSKYNGHEYVDLGLSVKWAKCNIGATNPQDFGHYFAWGATTGCDKSTENCSEHTFNWANAPFNNGSSNFNQTDWEDVKSSVLDANNNLRIDYDAAYRTWGGHWRMPTNAEFTELTTKCYWEWTSDYNNSGVEGYIVYRVKSDADRGIVKCRTCSTSQDEGSYSLSDNHIFLPLSRCRIQDHLNDETYETTKMSLYWSSSLNTSNETDDNAHTLSLNQDCVWKSCWQLFWGMNIRAVCY